MDKREFINRLFQKGKVMGIEDMEVYFEESKSFNLRVFNKEIDNYSISTEHGLSFRGLYNGKMGYSYTEKIDETSIDILLKQAIENAKIIDSDYEERLFEGSETYKEVISYNDDLDKVEAKEKIDLVKELELEAFKIDSRVDSVPYCLFGENSVNKMMINTKGLNLENKYNNAYVYTSVKVKEGEDIKTGSSYVVTNDFSEINPKALAEKAVNEALSMLGASSINSDEYPVIIRNDTAATLLEAFTSIFSAEYVQKGLSLLKGKINEKIANNIVSIIDDPFMEKGVASASFDGEGVATKYKKIIDKGVLKTYLHNTKTALKEGVETTGNAYKPSYKSPISIAPTNMYIEKGQKSLEDMIKTIERGLLIINLEGLHSGLNPVSGDFSLSAYGYEIESGKIKRPVNQITIAGNFYDLLNDIEIVGNDLRFALPGGSSYIGSPSIKIKKLSVAGE